jgi:hypothetical protein
MPAAAILWPLAVHLGLVALLYAWLTIERKRAVARGEAASDTYRTYEQPQPQRARLIANNLANQFELPVVFYPLALTLYVLDDASIAQVALAWVFVLARIVHTVVHVLSPDVALRGNVFAVNFVAAGAMWALFLWERLVAPAL